MQYLVNWVANCKLIFLALLVVVVLFGNEARGLPDDVLERSDTVVSIPIYGRAESLNLGTSAAVMLMSMAMSSRFGRM